MYLSPEEQKELDSLNSQAAPKSGGGLTPEEQKELDSLNHAAGQGGTKPLKQMLDEGNPFKQDPNLSQHLAMALVPSVGSAAALGKWLGPAVEGGMSALGLSNEPGKSALDRLKTFLAGGVTAGALNAGGRIVSSGANKAANSMMKRAVGLTGAKGRNAPADIGNRIVDEGIWGTKSGMADQVANKYQAVEKEIQDLAGGLEGEVSGDSLASKAMGQAKKHLNPETGAPIAGGEAAYATKSSIADKVRSGGYKSELAPKGPVSLLDASGQTIQDLEPTTSYGGRGLLALKRAQDAEAFNQSGQLGNTWAAEGHKAAADAARSSLSDLSEGAMPAALKREQTLINANNGLKVPDMTYRNPVSLTDIGASMVGGGAGGLPGAGTAVLASKAVASPLSQSIFAQGTQRLVAPVASAAAKISPQEAALLQSLFSNQSESPK